MIARTLLISAFLAVTVPAEAGTLSIAQKYIGLHERSNRATLKRMIGIDPARIPWCGAFAGLVIRKAGKRPPKGSNMARSWLRYGKPVRLSHARPGDVVVLGRKRGGHVGFLHSRKAGKVCMVSGNSGNMVRLACVSASRIKGVRR